MYSSLKSFIERLESEGELLRIRCKVDPHYEIAELTDRQAKAEGGGKALLFEKSGTAFPVVTNIFGSDRRMAMALGVEHIEEIRERIEGLLKEVTTPPDGLWGKLKMLPLLAEMAQWMPRRISGQGACQEVVYQGEEVNLDHLPILKCWGCDGGPFITLPMVHTLDPETGQRNVGMYRMQKFDNRTTGMHWHIHKTGARHYEGYRKLGKRMPVTVTLGGDPAYSYAATAPMPDNMDEYLLAGFLRHKPVKLVKCLTNDNWVPADCDFVLEGYVDPSEEKVIEGPFGDHTGFYSLEDYYPKFHITAITHRRDALYPATVVGVPPQEDAYIAKATERIFLAPIRLAVQPEVQELWMPTAGTAHNLALCSISNRYPGQPRKVAQGLWGAGQMMLNKYLVITPEGCKLRNKESLSRWVRGMVPERDIHIDHGVLDVLDHATSTLGYGAKAWIDLTEVDPEAPTKSPTLPREYTPAGGVELVNTAWVKEWHTLVLYAERERRDEIDIEAYLDQNGISGMKLVLLFDNAAAGCMHESDLVWLAAANTDPERDGRFHRGMWLLDARSKRPGYGQNPKRFPNVVMSLSEVIHAVDKRWSEYNIGELIPSPSRRYRKLWLSDRAEW